MKKSFRCCIVLAAALVFSAISCEETERVKIVMEKSPCDTIIIKVDTLLNITDTIYVDPADTTGMDSIFKND